MKVHKLRVNGGSGFYFIFWLACLSVIFIPVAILCLLEKLEVTTTDE